MYLADDGVVKLWEWHDYDVEKMIVAVHYLGEQLAVEPLRYYVHTELVVVVIVQEENEVPMLQLHVWKG